MASCAVSQATPVVLKRRPVHGNIRDRIPSPPLERDAVEYTFDEAPLASAHP